ncbi:MAG: hypothetical protein WBX11_06605 [Thiobacillaceae bacterium]|jgi:hypothetical protein
MTNYRRYIPPLVPTERAAASSVFPSPMLEHLRNKQRGRWKAELGDWENEGGSVAVTDVAATLVATAVDDDTVPKPRPIDKEAAARVIDGATSS